MNFHHRWAASALLVIALDASTLVYAAPVSSQGTWETTLQGRDLDGSPSVIEAYYDTALNITWLANPIYASTAMSWANANNWVTNLNINGYTGWRLPTVTDTGTTGCNFAYSGTDCGYNVNTATGEMAHMFYTTLGNKAYCDTTGSCPQPGWGLTNTGPFLFFHNYNYWSSTTYAASPSFAWDFDFYLGNQNRTSKISSLYVWAVHPGDIGVAVATVPVPAAVWLFGSGLAGLIGFARRHKAV